MGAGELPIIGPYVNELGWLAIVSLIIISWIKGWLWPSPQVDRIVQAYERIIEDKNAQIATWQSAYNNSDARADIFASGQNKLLDSVATTNASVASTNALIQTLIANRPSNSKETIT